MRPEDAIQSTIVDFVRLVAPRVRIVAVPNAARRGQGQRAGNAVPGLTPGVHDLIVILPAGRVLWWEVKQPGKGLDPAQAAFHADVVLLGHTSRVVRSIDDVRAALSEAGVATREAHARDTRPTCAVLTRQ